MEKNSEFKIPGFIETGEMNSAEATPFQNGDELRFHLSDLQPVDAMHSEAVGLAAESLKAPKKNIFERIGETAVDKIQLNGGKTVEMRGAEAAGTEIEALTISTAALQRNFDEEKFGLAA